jgi:hypothetical protein
LGSFCDVEVTLQIAMLILPVVISVVSLLVSITVAWQTMFRRGTVKMTQPTVIFLGPDGRGTRSDNSLPKVFLRTLLFATAKRGRIIECMYVTLSKNETRQNFNIWVYGNEKLARGSGLFVGDTGIEANHHFLVPSDVSSYRFAEGDYRLEVFARLLGDKRQTLLFSQLLHISKDDAAALTKQTAGLYFDWGPDSLHYVPHIEDRTPSFGPEDFVEMLNTLQTKK